MSEIDDLKIRQLDVVMAFLHGKLEEEIFMTQSDGFRDGTNRYCKLIKSIYGLKQSSRVWNSTLNQLQLDFGLRRSLTVQCVDYSIKGKEYHNISYNKHYWFFDFFKLYWVC